MNTSTTNFFRSVTFFISFLFIINVTAQDDARNYCTATATDWWWGEHINKFVTSGGETDINSTGERLKADESHNLPGAAYTDYYNDHSLSTYKGETIDFSEAYYTPFDITGQQHELSIWIDFNNNGVFESSEKVYSSSTLSKTHAGSFTIPSNLVTGIYRMRIRASSDAMDDSPSVPRSISPCGDIEYGSAEDYRLIILSPLPVTLTGFYVSCDKAASLKWTTASEQNSDKFIIEKSLDGIDWEYVAEHKAAGNSNAVLNYYQVDRNPWNGVYYYRLRQIDYDGMEQVYGPISVSCDENENSISVYPNPNEGVFSVRINSSQEINNAALVLVDMTGKVVSSQVIQIPKGVSQISIKESAYLNTGTYMLKMLNEGVYFVPIKVAVR